MFYQKNVHFSHHVHRLEQIFLKVAVLKEERIETMMKIVVEVVGNVHLSCYLVSYLYMIGEYVVECVDGYVVAGL